jgi:hypothetical protein
MENEPMKVALCRGALTTFLSFAFATSLVSAQVFDVTSFSGANGSGETAVGTSNGIGWTMSPTYVGIVPITNGTFTGFANPTFFSPAVAATDMLQLGAEPYTLTFSHTISSALIYLRADGDTNSGIDFGIAPTLVSGEVQITGTRADPSTNGGVVRLSNINATTLTHTPFIFNGVQMAWFVVPEPSGAVIVSVLVLVAGRVRIGRDV